MYFLFKPQFVAFLPTVYSLIRLTCIQLDDYSIHALLHCLIDGDRPNDVAICLKIRIISLLLILASFWIHHSESTMDDYLFHYDEWLVHYNCSFFNVDQIPLADRQHPIIGGSILGLAILFELLYIPCVISIHKHSHHPCYNIMRFISVLDIVVMTINGIFTGIGLINGWTYCDHPQLIFALGTVVTSKHTIYKTRVE